MTNYPSSATRPFPFVVALLGLCLCGGVPTAPSAQAQDMPLTQVLIDNEAWQEVASGYRFTEGPASDGKGNLFFTDVPNNRIHKLSADGMLSVFVEDSHATNGLMFGPDGRLYGCQNGLKRITAWDPQGKESTIAEDAPCNDLAVAANGGIYFTDPGNKRVWYIPPGGKKRIVDEGIPQPNGVILWPDQGSLVVADTAGPHLWIFRMEEDGSLTHKQPYYALVMQSGKSGSGADGMTVDAAGRLYVATHAGLQVFDPTGRLCGVIHKPQNAFLSNVVFGGEKLDTLFVTCTDKVYRRRTKAKGILHFQGPLLLPSPAKK